MGETPKQRIELAFSLSTLEPDEVPINVLIPRKGTPKELENCSINTMDIIRNYSSLAIYNAQDHTENRWREEKFTLRITVSLHCRQVQMESLLVVTLPQMETHQIRISK
jgi:hypothetical protein